MNLIQKLLQENKLKYKWDMDGYHESMNYRPLVIYHNENTAYFLVATERAIWANQIPIVDLTHTEGGVPIFLKCLETSLGPGEHIIYLK